MSIIREILDGCGGSKEVAYRLNLHQVTVDQWPKIGIPEKYWSALIGMSRKKLDANRIHLGNEEVRLSETKNR